MNYFIEDLHLFNQNKTGEGMNYDSRPFAAVDETPKELDTPLLNRVI